MLIYRVLAFLINVSIPTPGPKPGACFPLCHPPPATGSTPAQQHIRPDQAHRCPLSQHRLALLLRQLAHGDQDPLQAKPPLRQLKGWHVLAHHISNSAFCKTTTKTTTATTATTTTTTTTATTATTTTTATTKTEGSRCCQATPVKQQRRPKPCHQRQHKRRSEQQHHQQQHRNVAGTGGPQKHGELKRLANHCCAP